MSYESAYEATGIINLELRKLYQANKPPLILPVRGRPQLHIFSFYPLAYERYGTFRNRAPFICGELVLRALHIAPNPDNPNDSAIIYAGLQGDEISVGFHVAEPRVLNEISKELGCEISWTSK